MCIRDRVWATVTPPPSDSRTVFGPRPLFAAGGATKVIVDDFGYIDYTLTDQSRSIIKSSISDWRSQGIHYGAYYGLGGSETSAADDPAILNVARVVNLDGTLESKFSFTRQGQLDYYLPQENSPSIWDRVICSWMEAHPTSLTRLSIQKH